jgi:hypothetical protein
MRLSSNAFDAAWSLNRSLSVSRERSIKARWIHRYKSRNPAGGAAMNHRRDPAIDRKGNGFQQLFFGLDCVKAGGLFAVQFIKDKGADEIHGP